jgi:hypothetical protein
VERGEVDATPGVESHGVGRLALAHHDIDQYEPAEWAAVLTAARNPEAGRAFLQYLEGINLQTQLARTWPEGADPDADALLADLLGATLVDAHDELRAATLAVERHPRSTRAAQRLAEPLPWPPASVQRILDRKTGAMPLLETLAAQIAPEADVRAWLLRSWLAPARPVDGSLLHELATAEGGRLAREPRFRAWLRAEWAASARQRYRRVARLVQWGEDKDKEKEAAR